MRSNIARSGARLGLSCVLLVWTAQAIAAEVSEAFKRALADPQEQAMVIQSAKSSNVVIEDACPDAYLNILSTARVNLSELRSTTEGQLLSGAWVQDVFYAGCSVARTLHVLITLEEGKKPTTFALVPGTTHADARLQADVFHAPALRAYVDHIRDPACQKGYVDDTAFLDQASSNAPGVATPTWREAWTIAACNRKVVVLVLFTPDATGTGFKIMMRNQPPPASGSK